MSRPFALLLRSRNVDNTPCAASFMIRNDTISVKYTLPSRSTAGPSVNATVVAISGCCAARSLGTTPMRAIANAKPSSRRRVKAASSLRASPEHCRPQRRRFRPHYTCDRRASSLRVQPHLRALSAECSPRSARFKRMESDGASGRPRQAASNGHAASRARRRPKRAHAGAEVTEISVVHGGDGDIGCTRRYRLYTEERSNGDEQRRSLIFSVRVSVALLLCVLPFSPSPPLSPPDLARTKRDHQRKDPCEEGDREREVDPISPGLRPDTQDVGPNDAGAREQEKPGVHRTHLVPLSQHLNDKTGAQVFPSAVVSD